MTLRSVESVGGVSKKSTPAITAASPRHEGRRASGKADSDHESRGVVAVGHERDVADPGVHGQRSGTGRDDGPRVREPTVVVLAASRSYSTRTPSGTCS